MIQRVYLNNLKSGVSEDRKFIQVIVGPRQVGKTTMVSQLLEQIDMPYIFESADATASAGSVLQRCADAHEGR